MHHHVFRGRPARRKLSAVGLVLCLALCAAPSIEEMGRSAIREQVAEGKNWFTRFIVATDTADRELVASKLENRSFAHHAYGRDPDGELYTEHYYGEHLTASSSWWGKQRIVSACVRFERETGSVIATSIGCPDRPPFSDHTDEWAVV